MSGISLTTKWSAADVTVVKSVACWQNPTSLIWQKLSDLGDNVRSWHCAEWWHYSDREYIRYTDNEIMSWCTSGSITTCSLLGKTQFSNIQHIASFDVFQKELWGLRSKTTFHIILRKQSHWSMFQNPLILPLKCKVEILDIYPWHPIHLTWWHTDMKLWTVLEHGGERTNDKCSKCLVKGRIHYNVTVDISSLMSRHNMNNTIIIY